MVNNGSVMFYTRRGRCRRYTARVAVRFGGGYGEAYV
jgi:hypothetical protein